MYGGEIFVPKLPSFKTLDLIEVLAGKNNYYEQELDPEKNYMRS